MKKKRIFGDFAAKPADASKLLDRQTAKV